MEHERAAAPSMSSAELRRYVRRRRATLIVDAGGERSPSSGVAIYALADPRDVAAVRYVGQTRSPGRRYLQHVAAARLWLPDETPWWIESPRLRPLYAWLRELYRDDGRLPAMVVERWVPTADARAAERARILECLAHGRALLNVEAELAGPQLPLL
jgi:hypothetical protein